MHRLMLLRHAKAVPQGTAADEDRPLADRGRSDMGVMGSFFAEQGLAPDLALVSPSVRTRETWDLLSAKLPKPPALRIDPRLYAASVSKLLYLVRETEASVQQLLLIGHNPGLEELATLLAGSGQTDALIRFGGTMPTGSIAVIDLPGDWASADEQRGRLELFATPKSLGAER